MKTNNIINLVDRETATKAIRSINDQIWELEQSLDNQNINAYLIPDKKGVRIKAYDMEDDDYNPKDIGAADWHDFFGDMFTSGEDTIDGNRYVNRPMVKAFMKGLSKMMDELEKGELVCISDFLKEATDMIDKEEP